MSKDIFQTFKGCDDNLFAFGGLISILFLISFIVLHKCYFKFFVGVSSLLPQTWDVCEGRPNKKFKLFDGNLKFTMASVNCALINGRLL